MDIHRDFNLYYNQTWAYDRKQNRPACMLDIDVASVPNRSGLKYISDIFNTDTTKVLCGVVAKGGSIIHRSIFAKDLDLEIPTGMINHGNSAVFLCQRGMRTARKGFSSSRVFIKDLSESLCNIMYIKNTFFSDYLHASSKEGFNFIESAYNNSFYTVEEAMKELYDGKKLAVATSKNTAVGWSHLSALPIIYYYSMPVGVLLSGKASINKRVREETPELYKELLGVFKHAI